jgi:hypothetical protein
MSNTSVSIFQSWVSTYSSWESLKAYLTSEDVGVSIREFPSSPYAILRYVKGKTNFETMPELVWVRSVVWDTNAHRPICVAPRKASPGAPPCEKELIYETFVDGTMINVIATRTTSGEVEYMCSSRSQLNASGTFYSQKSFQTMFMEALQQKNISELKELFGPSDTPTEDVPSVFLSFVLQHPEHRVVERVIRPTVFLVQTGRVKSSGEVELSEKNPFLERMSLVATPILFKDDKELPEWFRQQAYQHGWTWQGYVFKDLEGNRWRIRNNPYKMLRTLRGSEAVSELRFLRLRAEGKVSDYLKHYHEDRQSFWMFEQKLRKETRATYDAYIEVHKAHAKKLGDLEHPIRTAVYLLHSHYLKDLRPQNKTVGLGTAIELINAMPHWQQAQFLKA